MIPAALLDRCIARIVAEWPDAAHEIDVIVRMGATRGRQVSVDDAADRLCITTQTLSKRLTAAGGAGSATLLAWGRIIGAMHAWEPSPTRRGQDRALCAVAMRCGWSDGFVLSRRFHAHTGINPTTWAKAGADFDQLVDLFLARWRGVTSPVLRKNRRKAVHV